MIDALECHPACADRRVGDVERRPRVVVTVLVPVTIHGAAAGRGECVVGAGAQRRAAGEVDGGAGIVGQRDAAAVAVVAVGDRAAECDRAAGLAGDRDQLADVVGDGAVVGDVAGAAGDGNVGAGRVADRAAICGEVAGRKAGELYAGAGAVGRRHGRKCRAAAEAGVGEIDRRAAGGDDGIRCSAEC